MDRATRLCAMSPRMLTRRPEKSKRERPGRRGDVELRRWCIASSSACVGCSCCPSPALTMTASRQRVRNCAAPARLVADDDKVDLHRLDVAGRVLERLALGDAGAAGAEKLTTSAERRFSASSNESRVRVLDSKKRFTHVTPRRLGTRLMGRSSTSRNARAVWRMSRISSARIVRQAEQVAMAERAARGGTEVVAHVVSPLGRGRLPEAAAIGCFSTSHTPSSPSSSLSRTGRARRPVGHLAAHEVGCDGQLAQATVDERQKPHTGGAPEVEDRVERSAQRSGRCRPRRPRARCGGR